MVLIMMILGSAIGTLAGLLGFLFFGMSLTAALLLYLSSGFAGCALGVAGALMRERRLSGLMQSYQIIS